MAFYTSENSSGSNKFEKIIQILEAALKAALFFKTALTVFVRWSFSF